MRTPHPFRKSLLLTALAVLMAALVGCSSEVAVGVVVSDDGAGKVYGEKVRNAIDLALDEINAEPPAGKTVTVIYKNDESKPEVAVNVTKELIETDGVDMIIGGLLSDVALAMAPVCEEAEVILLSPTASAPELSQAGDWIFRNFPSDITEGTSMAQFARDATVEQVVVFSVKSSWGVALKNVFTERFEDSYRKVVGTFEFEDGASAEELRGLVDQAKELNPQGIYLIAYAKQLNELLAALDEAGVEGVRMSTSAVTEEIPRWAGEAAELLVYPQPPFDPESDEPQVKAFVEAYRSRFGSAPDTYAAHAYDAMKIMAHAIGESGTGNGPAVRSAMNRMNEFEAVSGKSIFDRNGDVNQIPRLFIIKDGQSIPYKGFVEDGGFLSVPQL